MCNCQRLSNWNANYPRFMTTFGLSLEEKVFCDSIHHMIFTIRRLKYAAKTFLTYFYSSLMVIEYQFVKCLLLPHLLSLLLPPFFFIPMLFGLSRWYEAESENAFRMRDSNVWITFEAINSVNTKLHNQRLCNMIQPPNMHIWCI